MCRPTAVIRRLGQNPGLMSNQCTHQLVGISVLLSCSMRACKHGCTRRLRDDFRCVADQRCHGDGHGTDSENLGQTTVDRAFIPLTTHMSAHDSVLHTCLRICPPYVYTHAWQHVKTQAATSDDQLTVGLILPIEDVPLYNSFMMYFHPRIGPFDLPTVVTKPLGRPLRSAHRGR